MIANHYLPVALLLLAFFRLESVRSFSIQAKSWDFQGHHIAYEVASRAAGSNATGVSDKVEDSSKNPVLLLNGFGVGSFHQHRLMPKLFDPTREDEIVVYGVDYLGQGASWPVDCDDGKSVNEQGLQYSADMWLDQVITFIEQVILPQHSDDKVHLVGNSVGGHLAAHIANRRPDLIESICLLNPTPVWGLNLPGWSGVLPAPAVPKAIGRYLFDQIRDLGTIDKYLENAYFSSDAYDEDLMTKIRGCTLGDGGHAAFASILWSPPLKVSETEEGDFQECLSRLECDVLLAFGKDDPWCKPAFAKTMLEALDRRVPGKVHRYVQVDNCGHCPNHEAPQAVASVLRNWVLASQGRDRQNLCLVEPNKSVFVEAWGATPLSEQTAEEIPLNLVDRLAVTFV